MSASHGYNYNTFIILKYPITYRRITDRFISKLIKLPPFLRNMEYLLFLRHRPDLAANLGPERRTVDFLQHIYKFTQTNKKSGRISFERSFRDMTGGIAVANVNSDEELKQFVSEIPVNEFMDIEIIPLEETKIIIEEQKRLLQRGN